MNRLWKAFKKRLRAWIDSIRENWARAKKRILFVDIPIMLTIIILSFMPGGVWVAELFTIALITLHFTTYAQGDRPLFRNFMIAILGTVGGLTGFWLFWWARELAFLLAFLLIPGVVNDGVDTYHETVSRVVEKMAWDAT